MNRYMRIQFGQRRKFLYCLLILVAFPFLLQYFYRSYHGVEHHLTPQPYSEPVVINPRAKTVIWSSVNRQEFGQDENYFHPGKKIINPYRIKFMLSGKDICSKGPPFLLVMIATVPGNRKLRDLIRHTWGSVAETQRWPQRYVNKQVKIVFLLGKNKSAKNFQSVRKENDRHKDIVMADFVDSYRNLSRKIIIGLSWVEQFCPDAPFVMKCDDDTFLHVPLLIDFLLVIEPNIRSSVIGYIHGKSKVARRGRWSVPYNAYPLAYFPPYAAGGAYVFPRELAQHVLYVFHFFPTVPVEDAYITGILTRAANGTHIHSKLFTRFGDKQPHPCDFLRDNRIACTRASRVLMDIWKAFVINSCVN